MIISKHKYERESQYTVIHPGPELQVSFTFYLPSANPFCRYKMPKMVLKQESRLNGVKTNVFNLDEIAKSLRVPEEGK